MKYIIRFFSSTKTMAVLLFLFAFSIAWATFIENDFGTDGARSVVYNAKWFELILVLGVINIIAVTIKFRLFKKEKISIFIFHFAFILIIVGAGITRYFGKEGYMHIREGETTNIWYTSQNSISIKIENDKLSKTESFPVLFSGISGNRFTKDFSIDNQEINVKLDQYIPQASKELLESPDGKPFIHLVKTEGMGREDIIIGLGDSTEIGGIPVEFSLKQKTNLKNKFLLAISDSGQLQFTSPINVTKATMSSGIVTDIFSGQWITIEPMAIYKLNNTSFVLKQFFKSASFQPVPVDDKTAGLSSALLMTVETSSESKKVTVWGQKDLIGIPTVTEIGGTQVSISYGTKPLYLPFKIGLDKFIIKRYPGSNSPSWFESQVNLNDTEKNVQTKFRIYMNHILKHRGYRFYQSSYDMDEKGTILSVNHDGTGTFVTYLGYLLMTIGMVLSLINKRSIFRLKDTVVPGKIASVFILVLFTFSVSAFGQDTFHTDNDGLPVIKKEHAELFGKILVQDNGGRIEPVNTLASEVLRKVVRKDLYKGQNPDQVFLGMMVFPEKWQSEPMIRIAHKDIQKILGIDSKLASFTNFFAGNKYGGYVLKSYVENAYRKKPANRSKFDNEVIRTDERLNICYLVYTGSLLKIFPDSSDSNHKWYADVSAKNVFKGEDSVFVSLVLNYYFDEINKSINSNNWQMPDKLISSISQFQQKFGKSVLPSNYRIKAEYFYNNTNVFARLTYIYMLVGFILLLFQFINIFLPKFSIRFITIVAIVIISGTFVYHTFGLILRWYVSGHAPWSNGYEALIFIAWSAILAGLIFSRKSPVTISTTAILASLLLMTAHLSWMDPQVTNLVPVLKSYWLVIHVAVITSSYSFLGMGALLALVNLLLMIFENKKNSARFEEQIILITSVIKKSLIAGIYLLSVGTFLGAVWANESWGRYWAWDPKETWSLITIIVYAIILHLHIISGLKGRILFNILSLVGFASVLMTYFGVNYYLSGLHSYAKGDAVPVPPIVYYSITTVVIISLLAIISQQRIRKYLIE